MTGRIVMEIQEDNKVGIFVRDLEPYDSIRLLISSALALLEGRAEIMFGEGSPLTEEEEQEIMDSLLAREEISTKGEKSRGN